LSSEVEISALHADGFPDDKLRNFSENAQSLKFETYGFEPR
jgi:hypothetical protein